MSDTKTSLVMGIDASAPRSCVVVGRVGGDAPTLLAADDRVDGANQASQSLDARIRDALANAGATISQVDWLACGRGPGTFTGTRVAVATMQGLSLGLGVGVLGLSTLEALAHSPDTLTPGQWVLPLLDARRGEVYSQLFEVDAAGKLVAHGEPECSELQVVLARLGTSGADPSSIRAIGPGVEPYADALPASAEACPGPTAAGLWAAICRRHAAGDPPEPADRLRALYLRATYAQLGLNKPKRPVFKSPLL